MPVGSSQLIVKVADEVAVGVEAVRDLEVDRVASSVAEGELQVLGGLRAGRDRPGPVDGDGAGRRRSGDGLRRRGPTRPRADAAGEQAGGAARGEHEGGPRRTAAATRHMCASCRVMPSSADPYPPAVGGTHQVVRDVLGQGAAVGRSSSVWTIAVAVSPSTSTESRLGRQVR